MKLKNEIIKGKQCVLLGKKRHIYEFTYMFDFLHYYGYISINEDDQYDIPLKKLTIEEWEKVYKKESLLIICDIEIEKYASLINEYDLIEAKDYIYFEDCFEMLDSFNNDILKDRKIAVWGTGETEKNFRQACKENNYDISVDIYIDNNLQKSDLWYRERPVRALSEIKDIKKYFIVIASIYYYDIKIELDEYGLIEGKDYLSFSCFMSKPSAMLKELVHTKEQINLYCNRPYTYFFYAWFGVYSCCSTWVKYPIGNPASDSPEKCWNSAVSKLYRLSADTRTYCFCKKDACGFMGSRITEENRNANYDMPERIQLGLDHTCNLHCTSCRERPQTIAGEQLKIRERFAEEIIKTGWLDKAKELEISGAGEALFSKIDRKILFSGNVCKRESISLMTNGILLNNDNLERLKKNFKRIRLIISIDAATEKTYKKIRRGGNWNVLLDNLERVGNMRLNGEIEYIETKMVVQKSNYKEMVDFVRMGKKYHVDKVTFTKLLNWDMYTMEEYLEEAMLNETGVIQEELEQILHMDIFKDEIVQITEFERFLN